MIICPVCEHQQAQGAECDNCGKKFDTRPQPPTAVAVERLPELEQNALVRPGLPVQAERLPELERTELPRGPDLPAQNVADLEQTRAAEVGAVPLEVVADLDRGREQDDGQRTALPQGQLVCRYCRNVQASGVICDKCGMRLPVVQAARPAARDPEEGEWIVCRDCGNRAQLGKLCAKCGARQVLRS